MSVVFAVRKDTGLKGYRGLPSLNCLFIPLLASCTFLRPAPNPGGRGVPSAWSLFAPRSFFPLPAATAKKQYERQSRDACWDASPGVLIKHCGDTEYSVLSVETQSFYPCATANADVTREARTQPAMSR
ncbi:hypothetical protein BDV18DRAFT_13035 [Aspergillus unguis]